MLLILVKLLLVVECDAATATTTTNRINALYQSDHMWFTGSPDPHVPHTSSIWSSKLNCMTIPIALFVCSIRRYDDTPGSIATDVSVVNNNHVIAVVVLLFVVVALFAGILQFDAAVHWRSHSHRHTAGWLMEAVASHRSSLPLPMALPRTVLCCRRSAWSVACNFPSLTLGCCSSLTCRLLLFCIVFVVLRCGFVCISEK